MNKICIDGFRRITKTEAKRRYNAGELIRITPVNMNPDNIWGYYANVQRESINIIAEGFETIVARDNKFDTIVKSYTYYACIDSETGKYPAYYIREV